MKKLILVLIMILLAVSAKALAGEDLETVANFEEGSSFYDMDYGVKIIAGAQGTKNINAEGKYKPGYTEQELKNIELAAVDTAGGSVTASMGGMQRAVGEAMLGSGLAAVPVNEAITAPTSFPYEFYVLLEQSHGHLTEAQYQAAIDGIPNQIKAAQGGLHGLSGNLAQRWFFEMNLGYAQNHVGPQPQDNNSMYWNHFNSYLGEYLAGYKPLTWHTTIDTPQIDTNYAEYTQDWQEEYNGYMAQIPAPPIMSADEYREMLNARHEAYVQQVQQYEQGYRQTHPMDSASNY